VNTQATTSLVRELIEDDLVDAEAREVQLWRYDEFVALGFEAEQALKLARARDVELSQGRRLAALGCPRELAFRILA
jgi:hypothetical protein